MTKDKLVRWVLEFISDRPMGSWQRGFTEVLLAHLKVVTCPGCNGKGESWSLCFERRANHGYGVCFACDGRQVKPVRGPFSYWERKVRCGCSCGCAKTNREGYSIHEASGFCDACHYDGCYDPDYDGCGVVYVGTPNGMESFKHA